MHGLVERPARRGLLEKDKAEHGAAPGQDVQGADAQLADGAAPVERRLFWRYKSQWQRAARIGDWKYLKILDNTFLFNVVDDPMERANLKERHKDTYEHVVAEWNAWNATMLPETATSFTENNRSREWVDRPGANPVTLDPDPELR